MKKKVIFVTKALWIGGIETALVNLLKYFDYDRYEVTLLVLKAELDVLDQIHPKCRVLVADRDQTVSFQEKYKYKKLSHLTEQTENPSVLHKMMMWAVPIIRWAENQLYIQYIRKLMHDEQFDTAVIYSDVAGETAVKAIKADKFLMFYHHGAMRHVYHDKIAYRKCRSIIAVSENQAEALRRFNPQYKDKIVAIHNLADVEGIREKALALPEEPFDSRKFNIVSVGRVSHEKGMDIAVRVCAELVKNGYDNIRWWIIGDGPAMQEVKDIIRELKMEKYVYITGMKENPYPYIAKADLYVQPSRFEGYPMSVLEAVILGKIVISTNNKGAQEMLTNLQCGILCEMDKESLAKRISDLILNPNYYAEKKKATERVDFVKHNRDILMQLETLM